MSRRRNRRERQLTNQIADQLQQSEDRIVRRLGNRISRSSRRGFIGGLITAFGIGWLFWSHPAPQRRAVGISVGTRHAIRGGGEPRVVNAGAVRFVFGVPRITR